MVNFWCNLCFWASNIVNIYVHVSIRFFSGKRNSSNSLLPPIYMCVRACVFSFLLPRFHHALSAYHFSAEHMNAHTYANVLLRFSFSNFDCSITIRRFCFFFAYHVHIVYTHLFRLRFLSLSHSLSPNLLSTLKVFDHIVHFVVSLLIYLMHFIFDCVIEFQSNFGLELTRKMVCLHTHANSH